MRLALKGWVDADKVLTSVGNLTIRVRYFWTNKADRVEPRQNNVASC